MSASQYSKTDLVSDNSFDSMVAQLNAMTIDYFMQNHSCKSLSASIIDVLEHICDHAELPFFPKQQYIYSKMLRFWRGIHFKECHQKPLPAVVSKH